MTQSTSRAGTLVLVRTIADTERKAPRCHSCQVLTAEGVFLGFFFMGAIMLAILWP